MRAGRLLGLMGVVLMAAACTPIATDSPTDGVESTASSAVTAPGATGGAVSTTPPIETTTTSDPAEDFLSGLAELPPLLAVTSGGYRTWGSAEGAWAPGPPVAFPAPAARPPAAFRTPLGVVSSGADGAVYLDGGAVVPAGDRVLADVATGAGTAIAVLSEPGRVRVVDLVSGEARELLASPGVVSASYGSGTLLVVAGTGAEAVARVVDATGEGSVVDLLADDPPAGAVVTPDGGTAVFTTTSPGIVFTLALGSQGPATQHRVGEGTVSGLDTDGRWVAGLIDTDGTATSFILDLTTDEVIVGPAGVRFTFARDDRRYPAGGGEVVDGRFFGFLPEVTADRVSIDYAEFLTGEEAAAAAEAAGEESPPPNDFFIRDDDPAVVDIPLAPDANVRLQANFPEAGIGLEPVTVEQWLGLRAGDTAVVDFEWYGAGSLPYRITVRAGVVVAVEEVYLP